LPTLAESGEAVGAWVGTDPFVLVHAPIWPEANQLLLVRAAAQVGVPMVVAGPVADVAYAERLREFAPEGVVLIGEPPPAALATLYRSAAVFADAAWTARGHGRVATAAAWGAAIVRSQARWVDLPETEQWAVDPADLRSVARGIGEAWDAALRSDPRILTTAAFARTRLAEGAGAVVATYAKIVQAI